MSTLRFDMLVLAAVIAGVVIGGIYLFMLAIPRNDDERIHDGLSAPGHLRTHLLRALARLRQKLSR